MHIPRAALAAALLCTGVRSQVQVTDYTPLVLKEMARFVTPCVQPTTTTRVFTRCYDTHSSIHAHWAAYRIALCTPDVQEPAVVSHMALQPSKLTTELAYMRYPYAAAWYLQLAVDYERWALAFGADDPFRLRTTGDQVAAWLDGYYRTTTINPYLGEYSNPAWALYQLWSYYSFTGNPLAKQVRETIRKAFVVPIQGLSFAAEVNSRAFFSVIGNWVYVVARTQPEKMLKTFLAMQQPILDSHLIVNSVTSVHSYGLVWSRAWALRVLAEEAPHAADRRRFRTAADNHLVNGIARHLQYVGNFRDYDHWVPQFAVYAFTEGR